MKQFSLLNVDKNHSIALTQAGLIIGRDTRELDCCDRRISRKHGIIQLTDEKILLKSTHANPIFYKLSTESAHDILGDGDEVLLGDRDSFKLLPTQFIYEVKITSAQEDAPGLLIRSVSQINTNIQSEDIALNLNGDNIENTESSPPQQRKLPSWMLQQTSSSQTIEPTTSEATKRPAETEPEENSSKKVKSAENIPETAQNILENPIEQTVPPTNLPSIKTEPTDNDSSAPSTSASSQSNVPIKMESTDNDTSAPSTSAGSCSNVPIKKEEPNPNPPIRPSCEFGIGCYRLTQDHRAEMAHPGNRDYRRPPLPTGPENNPCPYWAACYRRNPTHFAEFSHPDPNAMNPMTFSEMLAYGSSDEEGAFEEGAFEERANGGGADEDGPIEE